MAIAIAGAGCASRNDSASGAQVIEGSLKLSDGDGATTPYLTRTNSSSGNRRTWTFSGWVKRTRADNSQTSTIISYSNTTTSSSGIEFGSPANTGYDNKLRFNSFNSGNNMDLWSEARYQDLSSWYHIVQVYDTTETTESNRVKMYVNGEQVTNWSAASYPTNRFPDQNDEGPFCYAGSPGGYIGAYYWSTAVSTWKGNFYYSDFYLLDGYIAGPENFGFTDQLTGTWRPKKYEVKFPNRIGKFFSANFAASDGFQSSYPALNAFNGGYDASDTDMGRAACSSSGCTLTLSSIGVTVNRKLEIWSGYGSASVNGGTAVNFDSSNRGWQDLNFTGALSSIVITGASGVNAGELYAVRVDGVILVDNGGYGTTGFYLPFDGSAPVGEDQSGSGNDWQPNFFGGSVVPSKATGAEPILQIANGGKVASAGVTSTSYASSLVLAAPLCMYPYDESYKVRGGSKKVVQENGNVHLSRDTSVLYGASYEFDGTGDYLNFAWNADVTDFGMGTGDFTLEAWVYPTALPSSSSATFVFNLTAGDSVFGYDDDGTLNIQLPSSGAPSLTQKGPVVCTDRWQHLACVRESGAVRGYINGTLAATVTDTTDMGSTGKCIVGNHESLSREFTGYMNDVRVYKGLAKYTSDFIPASSIPDIVSDSPSNIVYGSNPKTPINGSVQFSDGNYLTTADSADWYLGDTFTVEAWVYPLSGSDRTIVAQGASGWKMYVQSNGRPTFYDTTGGEEVDGDAGHVEDNKWSHVAFSCNSGTGVFYINGEESGSSGSMDVADYSDALEIGREGSDNNYWPGWISNLRIVKGTALYTTNFNPIDLDQPLTDVTNTKLLCCQDPKNKGAYVTSPAAITSGGTPFASGFNPYDEDLPTVLGKGGTFATMNPLANSGDVNLSDGNLTIDEDASGEYHNVTSTLGMTSGKFYCEYRHTLSATGNGLIGIAPGSFMQGAYAGSSMGSDPFTTNAYGFYTYNRGVLHENSYNMNGVASNVHSRVPQGSTIGIALDMDNYKCWWSVDGIWQTYSSSGVDNPDPVTGAEPHASGFNSDSDTWYFCWTKAGAETGHFNFGQQPFRFDPPEGYKPLCTSNLERTANALPDQYVGVTTYIGSGDGTTYNNASLKFKPDMTWFKEYDSSINHVLYDSVRGYGNATYAIRPNTTDDQDAFGDAVVNTNSNGFSVTGSNTTGINGSGENIVCWAWKAGGSSDTFNVDDVGYSSALFAGLASGSITPTAASVGTKQGFSIIGYTGTGSLGTISHGLTSAPEFLIVKRLSANEGWQIYHAGVADTPEDYSLELESTGARSDTSNRWNDTAPTSTVFTVNTHDGVNASGSTYISYLWHSIPGVQKFGWYEGNNSTNGPFIGLGFQPAIIIFKNAETSANWMIYDDSRDFINTGYRCLYPNLTNAQNTTSTDNEIDILSDGFKLRNDDGQSNDSERYIYMAWAKSPFHNLYGAQANPR